MSASAPMCRSAGRESRRAEDPNQAHCTAQDIKLVDVVVDAGESAKTLERPGIQAALKMLKRGKADALIVMKLDRLTRSVKDLGHLCESYFSDGKPWSLLSVSDSIDTRSASGKLILNVLTSVAQWEREAISDRTKEAMQHLKAKGVLLGAAPYGWKYAEALDVAGRRKLVEDAIRASRHRRICELYETDMYVWQICEQLDAEKGPRTRPTLAPRTVYRVLRRAGYEDPENKPRRSEPSLKQRDARRKETDRARQSASGRPRGRATRTAAACAGSRIGWSRKASFHREARSGTQRRSWICCASLGKKSAA